MTKNQIAEQLCPRLQWRVSNKQAREIVDAVLDILSDSLGSGENVYLRGFGILKVKDIAARRARNIKAGEPMTIPAHKTVRLKISRELLAKVNNGTVG